MVEVPELPGCMAHGKTRPEAIRQAALRSTPTKARAAVTWAATAFFRKTFNPSAYTNSSSCSGV